MQHLRYPCCAPVLFELPSLKISLICSYLLPTFNLVTLEKFVLTKKCQAELIASINTSITNRLRCDLARVRKVAKCYIMLLPRLIT